MISRSRMAALALLVGSGGWLSPGSAAPLDAPLLLVTDPAALQAAEAGGAGFARWFSRDERPPEGEGIVTNERLMREPAWQSLVQPLRASIARIESGDRHAGDGVAGHPHRLFDARWLGSGSAFFELVGVVNRLDRRPFQAEACSETRLVFRLAYRDGAMASHLPMTVAVELRGDPPVGDGSCRKAASLWRPPAAHEGAALGRWLVSEEGPLAPGRLSRGRLAQIAVNLQGVRWPSGVRPDLGGHAEYILRAFTWLGAQGRFGEGPLENTPDVARVKREPGLRAELLDLLRRPDSLAALDAGTLRLPDRFLAREAVSVAPLGSARLATVPSARSTTRPTFLPCREAARCPRPPRCCAGSTTTPAQVAIRAARSPGSTCSEPTAPARRAAPAPATRSLCRARPISRTSWRGGRATPSPRRTRRSPIRSGRWPVPGRPRAASARPARSNGIRA